jgi:hypothetical protein
MNDAQTTSMEKIIKAVALDDFKIEVLTSSGLTGVFDVKPYLKGSAFKALLSESYFKQVKPMHYGISWPDELDLSSDTVIYDMKNHTAGSHLLKA